MDRHCRRFVSSSVTRVRFDCAPLPLRRVTGTVFDRATLSTQHLPNEDAQVPQRSNRPIPS